jgi:hypothetical protein
MIIDISPFILIIFISLSLRFPFFSIWSPFLLMVLDCSARRWGSFARNDSGGPDRTLSPHS